MANDGQIANLGIAIHAENKTADGLKATERAVDSHIDRQRKAFIKRGKQLGFQFDEEQKVYRSHLDDMIKSNDTSTKKMSMAWARHFSTIEQASARAFGGTSMTAKAGGVVSELGDSFLATAAAAQGLGSALGPAGMAIGTITALTIGATAAASKMASGWAKSAAQIGRSADYMGVSSGTLQAFMNLGDANGMTKEAAGETLGNIDNALTGAASGQNPAAMQLLAFLRVGVKKKADGSIDMDAMLPAIADAITAQKNPAGRRQIAQTLGIAPDALDMFSHGGRALNLGLAHARKTGQSYSDDEIVDGKRRQYIDADLKHAAEIPQTWLGKIATYVTTPMVSVLTHGAQFIESGGHSIRDSADIFAKSTDKLSDSIDSMTGAGIPGGVGRRNDNGIFGGGGAKATLNGSNIDRAVEARDWYMAHGLTLAQASGLAANEMAESGGNTQAVGDSGLARGLYQWHPDRQANFRKVMGKEVWQATADEQRQFKLWELSHGTGGRFYDATDAASAGAFDSLDDLRPAGGASEAATRGALANQIAKLKVDVHIHNGKIASTKVTTSGGAISTQFAN